MCTLASAVFGIVCICLAPYTDRPPSRLRQWHNSRNLLYACGRVALTKGNSYEIVFHRLPSSLNSTTICRVIKWND